MGRWKPRRWEPGTDERSWRLPWQVKKQLPAIFFKYYVKPNSFKNQPKCFLTIGLRTQLATGTKQDAETVYKFTKALLANTKEFSKYHGLAKQWNLSKTLSNPISLDVVHALSPVP